MSRGDYKLGESPFGAWVATVEAAHRVRLPREFTDTVAWLAKQAEGLDCVGMPGPVGGLQVRPHAVHEDDVRRLSAAIGNQPPRSVEATQRWMSVARLLATAWAMTIQFESGRFSLTLPEPARRMQLVPQAGGIVVVFGFGEVLEIWDAATWLEHVRTTGGRGEAAISEAIEDLERR